MKIAIGLLALIALTSNGQVPIKTNLDGSMSYGRVLPTNQASYAYHVWQPLFAAGQTSYAQRTAYLNSLPATNGIPMNIILHARVVTEMENGNTGNAISYAQRIAGDEYRKTTVTVGVYLYADDTNGFVSFCTNYLALAATSSAVSGDSIVLVANRYCGYLKLNGGSKTQISCVAKDALKVARVSQVEYATPLFNRVQPSCFASAADYKEWLRVVVQNVVFENPIPLPVARYLATVKTAYSVSP